MADKIIVSETWKSVVGYEGRYELSDQGKLRSYCIRGSHKMAQTPTILKPQHDKDGASTFLLVDEKGNHKRKKLARLMWESFMGPIPRDLVIRHWDDDNRNNCLENLRIGTHQENMDDKVRNGKQVQGAESRNAKLTDSDVKDIFRLSENGLSQRAIAKLKGVSQSTILFILKKTAWTHVSA